jgi:thioredoxin-related protein
MDTTMNKFPVLLISIIALACTRPALEAAGSVPDGWMDDYHTSQAAASEQDRLMLLMFTGSDWCGWCVRMHDEILDTATFMQWAGRNLVLVYVDFPREDYRSPATRSQNRELDERYGIGGYPTLVLTDAAGKELTRMGYMQGGPKTFIRAIQRAADARRRQ